MSPTRRAVVTGAAGFTPPLSAGKLQDPRTLENGHESMYYYVYVLRNITNTSWYIGCTSDLRKRLSLHQGRSVPATKGKGPWELFYYEAYRHQATAYRREQNLKQFGGAYRQLKRRLIPNGRRG